MQPQTIIFIGPQGSGRGTQIEKLDAVLNAKDPTRQTIDLQTGRRFRALAIRSEGYTEKHLAETLNIGILQPLFLSVLLWAQAMSQHLDPDCHALIDGFPRTVTEAQILEGAFSFYKRKEVTVINLNTPEETVRGRMIVRSRADDTLESIEARLKWYREETTQVLEYYKNRENTEVINIDGTQSIDEVHTEILAALQLT